MYRRDLPGNRNRIRHPERRLRNRPARPDQACFAGPGAHCTAHKPYRIPKILTSSTVTSFVRISANARHAGIHYQGLPKTLTLPKNAVPPQAGKRLPKNLTVTASVSKIPMPSDTYAQKAFGCAPPTSPKSLTFRRKSFMRQPHVRPRNLTCAKSGTAKMRFLPVLAGFSTNSAVQRSRKTSPLTIFRANSIPEKSHLWPASQPVIGAEKSHLKGIWAGKPAFPPKNLTFRASQALTSAFTVQNGGRFPEILTPNTRGVP